MRRASLGKIGRQDFALCVPCNDANLPHREDAPQYETATLEAASASYDRAPNPYAYGVPS